VHILVDLYELFRCVLILYKQHEVPLVK
jgi:hypothetical protein